MISFCARFKAIALVFNETMNTRETRGLVQYPTPGSGKIARSGKPPSTGKLSGVPSSTAKEVDALLQPELSTPPTISYHYLQHSPISSFNPEPSRKMHYS
jgi:hypothetical protein